MWWSPTGTLALQRCGAGRESSPSAATQANMGSLAHRGLHLPHAVHLPYAAPGCSWQCDHVVAHARGGEARSSTLPRLEACMSCCHSRYEQLGCALASCCLWGGTSRLHLCAHLLHLMLPSPGRLRLSSTRSWRRNGACWALASSLLNVMEPGELSVQPNGVSCSPGQSPGARHHAQ